MINTLLCLWVLCLLKYLHFLHISGKASDDVLAFHLDQLEVCAVKRDYSSFVEVKYLILKKSVWEFFFLSLDMTIWTKCQFINKYYPELVNND